MPEFLFASGFSAPATAALWCTAASVVASVLLLLYTLELRIRRRFAERRRERVAAFWRTIIAGAMAPSADPGGVSLPKLRLRDRREFLRLWNRTRNMVEGAAGDRLIDLVQRLDLVQWVRRHARHSHLGTRLLAVQTLGYLRDEKSWESILAATDDENVSVSITAAEALAEIDPARAVSALMPKIAARRDWPRNHVFRLLQKAGSEAVSEPLYRAIRTASDADAAYLLQYAALAEFDVRDAVAAETIATRQDPDALAAALKVSSGHQRVAQLHELSAHPVWYVRMQAARLLGRTARPEDASRLEGMLTDESWWVRYRAASALAGLAALSEPDLEAMKSRQTDRYARDSLEQAIAEARRK
jgi:HEAT repeat protein